MTRPVLSTTLAFLLAVLVCAPAAAVFVDRGSEIDVDGNGANDLRVEACSDCGGEPNRLVHVEGSGSVRAGSSDSWEATDCDDALGATYGTPGPFLPSLGEVYLITSGGAHFGKLRFIGPNGSSPAGMGLEWQSMTCTLPGPPTTNFLFATYDLLAYYVDVSSNSPTDWSWRLGDGNSVGGRPTVLHDYECFPFYPLGWFARVCLEASNAGGDGTPHGECLVDPAHPTECCKNVWSWPVPSTIWATNALIDLDADGVADFQVLDAPECSAVANKLSPRGQVTWDSATSSAPYWEIGLADLPLVVDGTSDFCPNTADPWSTLVFHASNSIVKAWFPANKDSSPTACVPAGGSPFIRIAYEVLIEDCPTRVEDLDRSYSYDTVGIGTTETHEACVTLSYGPGYHVYGAVDATAAYEIVIGNGFTVYDTGKFTARIGW